VERKAYSFLKVVAMTSQARDRGSVRKTGWDGSIILQWLAFLRGLGRSHESADYQAWRHRFLIDRLRLCLWIAVLCFLTIVVHNIYEQFLYPQAFNEAIIKYFGNPDLADRVRTLTVATNIVVGVLLSTCLILQRTFWGHRYPAILFLWFSWSTTLVPQIVGTLLKLPDPGFDVWFLVFLAQATLMPVHWRLHLISQLGALIYYAGVNPVLGLTTIEGESIYHSSMFLYLFWFCMICDLAVYLYEKLQRAEFESRRELRVFVHAVSHDLKTPVMGTHIVLRNLLQKVQNGKVIISESVIQRLLQGSDRQLTLINSMLEAHESEIQGIVLHRESLQLRTLVDSVLGELEPVITRNQIILINSINSNLPSVNADSTQLWRVFNNLITNAIKHNPHGIKLTINAEVVESSKFSVASSQLNISKLPIQHSLFNIPTLKSKPQNSSSQLLRCTVQDDGVGIPPAQCEQLFELYSRGSRARYMPGLGLGLYLCRQIITAHGGQIGVISNLGEGSTFWFTLPLEPV
jgi:signal transduction histidine kinase